LALINKTKFLNDADFIIRLLYKHSYWSRLNLIALGLILSYAILLIPLPLVYCYSIFKWHLCLSLYLVWLRVSTWNKRIWWWSTACLFNAML